jgi:hypothetical protein
MGLTEKCTPHSMTDLTKSYRMGFEKLDSNKATFFCIEKISKHTHLFEKK